MSNDREAYHYRPTTHDGDPASNIALGHYRTFINNLALNAIDLATSPDDAPHEVAIYLDLHQTELDLAFRVFANVFLLSAIGALTPVDEGFPHASTAGNNNLTTGNSDPTPSALNDAGVSSTVVRAPATSNNAERPPLDAQLNAVAAGLGGWAMNMEAPETGSDEPRDPRDNHVQAPQQDHHTGQDIASAASTRAAAQRQLDAASTSTTGMTASTQQISSHITAQVNGTGTLATTDANGDSGRLAESDGLHSQDTDSPLPEIPAVTSVNGNGAHDATEGLSEELSDIALADDSSSAAPTDRGSDDDPSRASSATDR